MKILLAFLCIFSFNWFLLAQDNQEVTYTAKLSKREMLAGHTVKCTFTIENAQNARFTPPEWPEEVMIVSGPNQSSQVQMVNGNVTSNQSWSYTLKVNEVGTVRLPGGVFAVGGQKYTTEPLTLIVKPNPDGQPDEVETITRYDFWGNPIPEQPQAPPKPRRPTVRL